MEQRTSSRQRRPGKRLDNRKAGVIFLAVGIGLFVILGTVAVVLTVRAVERSDWPHADGTVIDVRSHIERDRDSDGDYTETKVYTPQVEFTVDGETYRFTSRTTTSNPWAVGDSVDVVYNADNPNEAFIAGSTTWVPWVLGGMALVFGGGFGGAGVLLRRSATRR